MKRVLVLLSTYNGEKYLEEQLLSIFRQDHHPLDVLVRDDGSSDQTLAILKAYQKSCPSRIKVVAGENLGVKLSFFALLAQAPENYDYYAFSDQDDYWLPDKISRALSVLADLPTDRPACYCSRLIISDASLRPIGLSPILPATPSYRQALFSSDATGCTMVFNDTCRKMALLGLECARTHDSWLYQVAVFLGRVRMDHEARILYRQHGRNVVGMKNARLTRLLDRIRRVLKQDSKFTQIYQGATCFWKIYQNKFGAEERQFLNNFLHYRDTLMHTLTYAMIGGARTNRFFDTLALRLMIFFRRI